MPDGPGAGTHFRDRNYRPRYRETGAGHAPGNWNFPESVGRLARETHPFPVPATGFPVIRGECERASSNRERDFSGHPPIRDPVGLRMAPSRCHRRGLPWRGRPGALRFSRNPEMAGVARKPPSSQSGRRSVGRYPKIPGIRCQMRPPDIPIARPHRNVTHPRFWPFPGPPWKPDDHPE